MLRILFSKFIVYILCGLLLSSFLQASPIKVTEFQISYGIDDKNNKPIRISKSIDAKTKQIYASAWVHNIFPLTQFNIKWYRYNQQKKIEVLYQYKVKLDGTQFIYSAISIPSGSSLPEGKYFVDILSGESVIASTSFNIVGTESKKLSQKNECIKPTKADNKILIDDQVQIYPKVKSELSSMNIRRFHDAKERFSLLAPSGWKENKNLDEGTLLYLSKETDGNSIIEYLIREIVLDKKTKSAPPKILLKAISEVILQESAKTGAKPLISPKIYELPEMTVNYFVLARNIDNINIWEIHTVIFDGKYAYDIVVMTDEKWLSTGRFLSSLASYGFWTKESCK